MSLTVPVLFVVFNRPALTQQVFDVIRHVKPHKLFIAADGPRENNAEDITKCQSVRAIIKTVDWDCETKTLFRDKNLGCKTAVSGAISWFFNHVEYGIILEDDCLPDPTFFRFCVELLEKYKNDDKIMMISGNNFLLNNIDIPNSYYFSKYTHIWGWATWRRAWRHYDLKMKLWRELKNKSGFFPDNTTTAEKNYWIKIFNNLCKEKINTWDYQWCFACWAKGGLSIIPSINLVSNIGFQKGATHTTALGNFYANLNIGPVQFPLRHPAMIKRNEDADNLVFRTHYQTGLLHKIIQKVRVF